MTGHSDTSNTLTPVDSPTDHAHIEHLEKHIEHLEKFKPVVGLVVPLDGHGMRHDDPYVKSKVNT